MLYLCTSKEDSKGSSTERRHQDGGFNEMRKTEVQGQERKHNGRNASIRGCATGLGSHLRTGLLIFRFELR